MQHLSYVKYITILCSCTLTLKKYMSGYIIIYVYTYTYSDYNIFIKNFYL